MQFGNCKASLSLNNQSMTMDAIPPRCARETPCPQSTEVSGDEAANAKSRPKPERSPLANLSLGLAWSNPSVSNELLVRKALAHGAFHLLLEAVLHHGLTFVEQQLAVIVADEDVQLSARAEAEIRRKLSNIRRGIAAAEQGSSIRHLAQ